MKRHLVRIGAHTLAGVGLVLVWLRIAHHLPPTVTLLASLCIFGSALEIFWVIAREVHSGWLHRRDMRSAERMHRDHLVRLAVIEQTGHDWEGCAQELFDVLYDLKPCFECGEQRLFHHYRSDRKHLIKYGGTG